MTAKRLVTGTCSCGRPEGFYVDEEARGVATATCKRCHATFEVVLDPSEASRRPSTSPEGLRLSLAAAHEALERLEREVVEYLRVRDLEVEELPENAPIRRAVERARYVLRNKPG